MQVYFANASVTLVGTRIIYDENKDSANLVFNNSDSFPYVVQSWVGLDSVSSVTDADSSFIISPQIFKVNAKSGQVARLIYNGKPLAKDRESLFYFNFLQIPPIKENQKKDSNGMVIFFKNTVKLFYRPSKLKISTAQIPNYINVSKDKNKLKISNNSPYFLSISSIKLHHKNDVENLIAEMIDPFSSVLIPYSKIKLDKDTKVEINYIDDRGAILKGLHAIK